METETIVVEEDAQGDGSNAPVAEDTAGAAEPAAEETAPAADAAAGEGDGRSVERCAGRRPLHREGAVCLLS